MAKLKAGIELDLNNDIIRGALVLSVIVSLFLICFLLGHFGLAGFDRIFESKIVGSGTIDQETNDPALTTRSMAKDAKGYESYNKLSNTANVKDIKSTFDVQGGDGSRQTQYKMTFNGAGHSGETTATLIKGNFSGSYLGYINVDPDTGVISLDTTTEMNGNATFYGKIVDASSGKPLTVDRLRAIGNASIWQNLNITTRIEEPEDWLGFCAEVEQGLPGIRVIPGDSSNSSKEV